MEQRERPTITLGIPISLRPMQKQSYYLHGKIASNTFLHPLINMHWSINLNHKGLKKKKNSSSRYGLLEALGNTKPLACHDSKQGVPQ